MIKSQNNETLQIIFILNKNLKIKINLLSMSKLHEPMLEKWPKFIVLDGRKVYRVSAEPTFATYMCSAARMNKKIYLTREKWESWVRGDEVKPKKRHWLQDELENRSKNVKSVKKGNTWADLVK